MNTITLTKNDLRYCVERLPRDLRELLTKNHGKLFVGGGFLRATIAGETPNDIDLFGDSKERLSIIADDLVKVRPGAWKHTSKNAITVITPNRMTVQFITRWVFVEPDALVKSFDFTVCQAAIWRAGHQSNSEWKSAVGENFYVDLAARRLVYTNPVHDEEAGGSMLRVIKYVKRGYTIQVTSLGWVIARMFDKMDPTRRIEIGTGQLIAGMLREVDPRLVIDGFDVVEDHEPVEEQPNL